MSDYKSFCPICKEKLLIQHYNGLDWYDCVKNDRSHFGYRSKNDRSYFGHINVGEFWFRGFILNIYTNQDIKSKLYDLWCSGDYDTFNKILILL